MLAAGLTFHPGALIIIKIGFFGVASRAGLGVNLRPFSQTGLRLLWVTMLIRGCFAFRCRRPTTTTYGITMASGEICPHHDHLLRWHPTAGQADDVAVVHWHWIIPQTGDSGDNSGSENDNPLAPRSAAPARLSSRLSRAGLDGDPVIVRTAGGGCCRILRPSLQAFISLTTWL